MNKQSRKGDNTDKFNKKQNPEILEKTVDDHAVEKSFKDRLNSFKHYVSAKFKEIRYRDIALCAAVSWIVVLILEILGRHSFINALGFMVTEIGFYFANFAIVLSSVTLCLFFKRRYFALSMVLLVWLGLGIANGIILSFRNTPLAWVDLSIVFMAFEIMNSYVKIYQVILGIVGVVLVLSGIVLIAKYAPKRNPNYVTATLIQLCAVVVCVVSVCVTHYLYTDPEIFLDMPQAYKNYGFVYCFSSSAVNRGVAEPDDYTPDKVKAVVDAVTDADTPPKPDVEPNIIYVQLESFFDVKNMKDVTYSEDPLPNFTRLKSECSSGYLRIPGLGGGTCNSEFEVLTGMSVGMFGTGEYPYNTITQEHTVGSVCYELKDYGYSTHAIHNHTGTFYNRHINYRNLGFDTFTSIEYMSDVERNPNNWAKDKILTKEILKCLDSSEDRDFVFAVSVQGHGNYPSEVIDPNQTIYVTSPMNDIEYRIGYEYYINQLREMDEFIGELITTFENYDEPVVLVLYGDHLPAFNITKEQLKNESLFETEYVIWANYSIPVNDEYLCAYQLNSRVTEMLGFKGNYINSLHRYFKNDKKDPDYANALQLLIYDQLYGDNYAYDGVTPFKTIDTQYGVEPIEINSVELKGTSTVIRGTGFTEKSVVFIDDTEMTTSYLNEKILVVRDVFAEDGDMVYVGQMTSDGVVLSQTEEYEFKLAP